MTALAWVALAGSAQAEDLVVNSFDGTPIVAHWFPNPSLAAGQRAPVVLNGPGWSPPGENNPSTGAIKRLHDLGYNVLTWDPRGFGVSGGEATHQRAAGRGTRRARAHRSHGPAAARSGSTRWATRGWA